MTKYLKKEERKEQIKQAAIELITEKGYRSTHVQDIVDKIGYSKGGFYNCYQSKEELFIEILKDGMKLRFDKLKKIKFDDKVKNRKAMIIEALLDKMLDYNYYKKLYTVLVSEMRDNKYLMDVYKKSYGDMRLSFVEFCKKEGFEEYIKISNQEFESFISSMIISVDLLDLYDNKAYRDMIKTMMEAYFEKINFFD